MLEIMKSVLAAVGVVALGLLGVLSASAATPLSETVIALDPGHGGSDTGAVNQTYGVMEKDVNLDVAFALKTKLEADGATVVLTREEDIIIDSRKERVKIAEDKCQEVAGRYCDILISLHHNGSSDPAVDGTMILYGNSEDEPLAFFMHDALVPLTRIDLGYDVGGWGISVHAHHFPAVITESYFITNDAEAEAYRAGTRVGEEAEAQYAGIAAYFSNTDSGGDNDDGGDGGGGGGNGNGPPDHARN